jgi:hypothetical protein
MKGLTSGESACTAGFAQEASMLSMIAVDNIAT